jgi:hydroxymethylglutaryl-CoA lyase
VICEVGPRDGLQNESKILETDKKVQMLEGLLASGLREVEAVSFVNPKWIPQMADADEVFSKLNGNRVDLYALIPNEKGFERAQKNGARYVSLVFSLSNTHNQKNVNRSTEESIRDMRSILQRAKKSQVSVRVNLATAFGCPYEGVVPVNRVLECVEQVVEAGAHHLVICDTIGAATPKQVYELFKEIQFIIPKNVVLSAHFHNTRGTGLANVIAALETGINRFDSSIGGLGGCPYAPGASGNIATEDLIYMLEKMGVKTGIDLNCLLKVVGWLESWFERSMEGKIKRALEGCGSV